jgi:hypothetical protein
MNSLYQNFQKNLSFDSICIYCHWNSNRRLKIKTHIGQNTRKKRQQRHEEAEEKIKLTLSESPPQSYAFSDYYLSRDCRAKKKGQIQLVVLANSHPYKYQHLWCDFKMLFVLLELSSSEITSLIFIASDYKRNTNFISLSYFLPHNSILIKELVKYRYTNKLSRFVWGWKKMQLKREYCIMAATYW